MRLRLLFIPTIGIALLVGGCWIGLGTHFGVPKSSRAVLSAPIPHDSEFGDLILPHFELHEATAEEAVEILNREISRLHPKRSIRVALWRAGDPIPPGLEPVRPSGKRGDPDIVTAQPMPGLESSASVDSLPAARATLSFKDFPVGEDLAYAAGALGLSCHYAGDTVYLFPSADLQGMLIERTLYYFCSSELLDMFLNVKMPAPSKVDVSASFRASGCSIPTDGCAIYDRNSASVLIRVRAPEDFDLAEAMITDLRVANSSMDRRKRRLEDWWWSEKMWIRSRLGLGPP